MTYELDSFLQLDIFLLPDYNQGVLGLVFVWGPFMIRLGSLKNYVDKILAIIDYLYICLTF